MNDRKQCLDQINMMIRVPASCGELVQGYIGTSPFLINSPIDLYATAQYRLPNERSMNQVTSQYPRAMAASRRIDQEGYKRIEIHSNIPRGKGMASSTAEISAALSAALQRHGILNRSILHKMVLDTDGSTDATYLPGVTMINQLTGEIHQSFNQGPRLHFMIIDEGGTHHTEGSDRSKALFNAQKFQTEFHQAIGLVKMGMAKNKAQMIAKAATISTKIHQHIEPHRYYDHLVGLIDGTQILGINRAHTGTILGLIFDPYKITANEVKRKALKKIPMSSILGHYPMITGGVKGTSHNLCFPNKHTSCREVRLVS